MKLKDFCEAIQREATLRPDVPLADFIAEIQQRGPETEFERFIAGAQNV